MSQSSTVFSHFQYRSYFTNNMKGLQKSFKMVPDSSLYDLSYHSYQGFIQGGGGGGGGEGGDFPPLSKISPPLLNQHKY